VSSGFTGSQCQSLREGIFLLDKNAIYYQIVQKLSSVFIKIPSDDFSDGWIPSVKSEEWTMVPLSLKLQVSYQF